MEFSTVGADNLKNYKYAKLITQLAHREKTAMYIDLDDLEEFEPEICARVVANTKRYISFFQEIVQDLIPEFKTHNVVAKDPLGKYLV